jgi:hypothetical protein
MSTGGALHTCPDERLIALAQGTLHADEAQDLEEHVTGCPVCARELRWLSAEQVMFSAHAEEAPPLPADAWDKIAARTVAAPKKAAPVRRGAVKWARSLGLAAAAPAVGFVAWSGWHAGRRPLREPSVAVSTLPADAAVVGQIDVDGGSPTGDPSTAPRAAAALDAADRDLDHAIAALQDDYQRRRASLPPARARRYDQEFTTALAVVEKARSTAGSDVSARRQVVRARARYLRSIQTVVLREGRS